MAGKRLTGHEVCHFDRQRRFCVPAVLTAGGRIWVDIAPNLYEFGLTSARCSARVVACRLLKANAAGGQVMVLAAACVGGGPHRHAERWQRTSVMCVTVKSRVSYVAWRLALIASSAEPGRRGNDRIDSHGCYIARCSISYSSIPSRSSRPQTPELHNSENAPAPIRSNPSGTSGTRCWTAPCLRLLR